MVFQIVDDILDITDTTEQLGKPAGHDLVEGVYTLPVLRTLAMENSAGKELASLLGRPLDVAERDKALAIVRSGEGVESAAATARQYVAAAEEACADLPPGAATDALRAAPAALLESAIIRRPRPIAADLVAPAGSPAASAEGLVAAEGLGALGGVVDDRGAGSRAGGRRGRPTGRGRPVVERRPARAPSAGCTCRRGRTSRTAGSG